MIIVATELHVRNFWKFFPFTYHAVRSANQVKRSAGCLHSFISGEGWKVGFTFTAWRDHDSMDQFRNSGAHKIAMKQIRNVASKYKTAIWESDILPAWEEARRKLDEIPFKKLG